MYACVCAAIKDAEILELKRQGLSLEEIIAMTSAGISCGSCIEHIEELRESP